MINNQLKCTLSFLIVTIMVLIIIVRTSQSSETSEDDAQNIVFNWAILHKEKSGQKKALNLKRKLLLFSGDEFKIFIQPIENVYIYLYLLDTDDNLSLLFPYRIEDLDDNYVLGHEYYFPQTGWAYMDENIGTETFYMLASSERLHTLEVLTSEYGKASGNTKKSVQAKVLAEIKSTFMRFSSLADLFAEKPIPKAGTLRSLEKKDPADSAVQIKAENFYGKTIRIEHK